jgi:two-component system sensor histidine kinase KdpD
MRNLGYDRFWVGAYEITARHRWVGALSGLVLAAVLVPVLTLAGGYGGPLSPAIPLFFLVPVLIASTLGGRIAGIIVSLAAVLAWDWFFIPPFHTPTIYSPRDVVALVTFLFVTFLTGELAGLARQRADEALGRARTSEALYDLSVALIGSHDLATILPILTQRLRETFDLRASAILLRDPGTSVWRTRAASGSIPDDLNIERSRNIAGVLSWVASTGQMCSLDDRVTNAGRVDETSVASSPHRRAQFWPLQVGTRLVGVLEMVYKVGTELDPQRDRLLATLLNGAAIALEQERLFREEQEAAVARESDRLKSALLSSVSHDLRTPLAGIKAAASSLLQEDVQWSEADRRAFVVDIDAEADRLARFVSNLLDLSRIEAGVIRPAKEWEDIGELVERVAARLRRRMPAHPIHVELEPGLPPARVDTVHVEQVLTNLIENAARYSPGGTPVTVAARADPSMSGDDELHLSVADEGPGIPPDEQERIFDKFYQVTETGRRSGGTGMGLAIVKGLVEASGGQVLVESEPGHGSTFTVVLPLDETLPGSSGAETAGRQAQELPAR